MVDGTPHPHTPCPPALDGEAPTDDADHDAIRADLRKRSSSSIERRGSRGATAGNLTVDVDHRPAGSSTCTMSTTSCGRPPGRRLCVAIAGRVPAERLLPRPSLPRLHLRRTWKAATAPTSTRATPGRRKRYLAIFTSEIEERLSELMSTFLTLHADNDAYYTVNTAPLHRCRGGPRWPYAATRSPAVALSPRHRASLSALRRSAGPD
jgi:hypothetical protein